jgi:hypothetical protein
MGQEAAQRAMQALCAKSQGCAAQFPDNPRRFTPAVTGRSMPAARCSGPMAKDLAKVVAALNALAEETGDPSIRAAAPLVRPAREGGSFTGDGDWNRHATNRLQIRYFGNIRNIELMERAA